MTTIVKYVAATVGGDRWRHLKRNRHFRMQSRHATDRIVFIHVGR